MKMRYCMTEKGKGSQCLVGWGSINCLPDGLSKMTSCCDEPMEKNCRMIIDRDIPQIEICPCCGTALGIKEELKEHLFFDHIREVVKIIRDGKST